MATATALTAEQVCGSLGSILGAEHASVRDGVVVATPGDVAQVAEVLRFANANGIAVMPVGGATRLGWGNPVAAGIQLSTRRLAQLREHAWQDLTCTVEAGCTWSAMQAALAQRGQMVALDPLWPEQATVGGIIAANDSGALRVKFGGLRDLIIGMTIVLADGTVAKSGGKVVKNVAGYDLHKLMTGSFGTLGVITEVNFRLHPAEQFVRTWTVLAPGGLVGDAAGFAKPLAALTDSQMTPSGVQVRVSGKECAVDIRMMALPECIGEYEARMGRIFEGFELTVADGEVWNARQRIFDSEMDIIVKISAVPGEICAVISELQRWAAAEGVDTNIAGQATGLITAGLKPAGDAAGRVIESLRERVKGFGGSAVVLRLPDTLRRKIDVWGTETNALPLMREIKRQFDPNRILNPGRFVGNI
ncbi:MAG TPA: FAD-binding oxidoreductase [Terracidiphilus sp.]|nr:FAD-binding oxidoreductase [Terracidiphilus sp.]